MRPAKSNVSADRSLFASEKHTASRRDRPAFLAPHSWEFKSWPENVWPNTPARGQWICRAYRRELVAAGALSRIGKNIVVMGAPYTRWIESRIDQVIDFKSNNPAIGTRRDTVSA
jgi:hypothetical protein